MQINAEEIRSHFLKFCCYINPEFEMPPHILQIGELLNRFAHNEEGYDKLVISLPPRMGKSYLCHVMLPAYLFGLQSREKILTATYAHDLSKTFSKEIISICTSEKYKLLFPETVFLNKGRSASTWDTSSGGYLKCSSRDGTLTGLSGTTIICDDILKNSKEAGSPTLLKSIREFFDSTLYSRLTYLGKTKPKIVILMTRWCKDDLISHVLDNDKDGDWKYFNLPAIQKDPITGEEKALWEERQPLKTLKDIRGRNEAMFSCVYMGRPGESSNSTEFDTTKYTILNRAKELDNFSFSSRPLYYFSSWDTASKVSDANDYSVGTLWAVRKYNKKIIITLEDYIKGKFTFPELAKLIESKSKEWECRYSVIEDANSGTGLYQLLSLKGRNRYKKVVANVKKKLPVIIPLLEDGSVMLRNFKEIVDELNEYPFGKNDDAVASIVNGIYYWATIASKTRSNSKTSSNKIKPLKRRTILNTKHK